MAQGGADQISRRWFLASGGAAFVFAACSGDGGGDATTRSTVQEIPIPADLVPDRPFTPADFGTIGTCQLLPEATPGPFPLDEQFDRRDITEGVPGHPVRLGLRVVDTECQPIGDAAVEVWHTDATGDYSAFDDGGDGKDEAEGTTFCRGTQTTGDDGIVEFLTIYPGWYRGRAVHLHLRVRVDEETVLTTQLFFDDGYTNRILTGPVYREFGPPDTSNADDAFAGDPGADGSLLRTVEGATSAGPGTVALLNLGVDPAALSSGGGSGSLD